MTLAVSIKPIMDPGVQPHSTCLFIVQCNVFCVGSTVSLDILSISHLTRIPYDTIVDIPVAEIN